MHASFIQSVLNTNSISDINKLLEDYTLHLNGDYFIYLAFNQLPFSSPSSFAITNYPKDWQDEYIKNEYFLIDPVMKHCMSSLTPMYWNELTNLDTKELDMIESARQHGLASGITMTVYSADGMCAIVSFASKKENNQEFYKKLKDNYSSLYLFSVYTHEFAIRLNNKQNEDFKGLTLREKECLMWAAEGKTGSEISIILEVHERTVIFHLNNSIKKLNANNRQQAIARAIASGQISIGQNARDYEIKVHNQ